jgi:hypothetical protein
MSENKLYRGTFSGEVYFLAESDYHANINVGAYVYQEVEDNGCSIIMEGRVVDYPDEKQLDIIPWGETGDKTIRDYLEEVKAAAAEKAEQELQDRLQMKIFTEVSA